MSHHETGIGQRGANQPASALTQSEAKALIAKWRDREQSHAEQQHANEAAIGDDRGQRTMRSLCRDAVEDIADLIACYAALVGNVSESVSEAGRSVPSASAEEENTQSASLVNERRESSERETDDSGAAQRGKITERE